LTGGERRNGRVHAFWGEKNVDKVVLRVGEVSGGAGSS